MNVIPYKSMSSVFNGMALKLAGVLGIMLVCSLVLGMLGKALFGRRVGGIFAGLGVLVGLFLVFKVFF